MSFPQTRRTLIRRIVTEGRQDDWHQFLGDYWQPVCRFAQNRGQLTVADAEDVAGETFEAVLRNRLLQRWTLDHSSKLRTLLCTVVRHTMGNRARVAQGRKRLLGARARELTGRSDLPSLLAADASVEQIDAFYAAWVQGLLQQVLEALLAEYHSTGKGNYFRVLHGRVCEQMPVRQIGAALGLTDATVQNHFRAARKRLEALLREHLWQHVARYCDGPQVETECQAEWQQLGEHLARHGGLERAIAQACDGADPAEASGRQTRAISAALSRMAAAPASGADLP